MTKVTFFQRVKAFVTHSFCPVFKITKWCLVVRTLSTDNLKNTDVTHSNANIPLLKILKLSASSQFKMTSISKKVNAVKFPQFFSTYSFY
jgi:hypothetical protein